MSTGKIRDVSIGALGSLLATALISSASLAFVNISEKIETLPWAWRILGALAVIAISAANSLVRLVPTSSGWHRFVWPVLPGAIGVLAFIVLVVGGPGDLLGNYFSLTTAILIVAVAEGVLVFSILGRLATGLNDRATIGFAATGVLIDRSEPQKPHFILVFNKNLQGGKGLWVPPGGHFFPLREDPVQKVRDKIRAEVGFEVDLIEASEMLPNPASRETAGALWFNPPVFLLREDLYGRCSHGHLTHIDYVYICVTDGRSTLPVVRPKYSRSQRLKVDLAICAQGYQQAQALIDELSNQWFRDVAGQSASLRSYVTDDLIWRLHLAAKRYLEKWKQ